MADLNQYRYMNVIDGMSLNLIQFRITMYMVYEKSLGIVCQLYFSNNKVITCATALSLSDCSETFIL